MMTVDAVALAFTEMPHDAVRLLNVALSIAVLVSMVMQWRQLRDATRSGAFLRLSVGLFSLSAGVGSWESLLAPATSPGVRTYLYTASLMWALAAIWYERRDFGSRRRKGKR